MANAVRTLRQSLVTTKNELKVVKAREIEAVSDNKTLRQLLSDDSKALSNYLGYVLGKKTSELAPAEKK